MPIFEVEKCACAIFHAFCMSDCNQYDHLRSVLFSKLSCPQFDQMNDQNKFCYMLTCPLVARIVGQFIIDAFDTRPIP